MDQNEQPNESSAQVGGEPSGDGSAKKKRRRRRGKKRGPGEGAAQTQGAEQADDNDATDGDDGGDDERSDAQGGSDGEAVGGTAEGDPARKKKRRRKKKKSGGDAAPDATRPHVERPQDARPQDARPQDARPQDARPPEGRQPNARPQDARPPEARQPNARPQDARPPEARQPNARPQRGQKQRPEPGSRGSVLQRRLDRIERDEPRSQPDPIETIAPPPTNVTNVDSYIHHLHGWQREVVTTLRALIRNIAPEIEESIKWSQPVYEHNGPVCYIKAFSDHVNFGFWRGAELDDPDNLLAGDLMKMRHVRIGHVNEVQRDTFERFVRQAVRLNKDKGDPTQS